jgi:hypothetical protein
MVAIQATCLWVVLQNTLRFTYFYNINRYHIARLKNLDGLKGGIVAFLALREDITKLEG